MRTRIRYFYHANIIMYCNRPWLRDGDLVQREDWDGTPNTRRWRWVSYDIKDQRSTEMTEDMIARWNSLVGRGDIVYHCGDFAFCKTVEQTEQLLKRLNGSIHLTPGNHDKEAVLKARGFASMRLYDTVKVDGQKIFNCHFPMCSWDGSHRGTWHCFGHVHGNHGKDDTALVRLLCERYLAVDVGADCFNFTPVPFETLKTIIEKGLDS